jgi:hypothetical protein
VCNSLCKTPHADGNKHSLTSKEISIDDFGEYTFQVCLIFVQLSNSQEAVMEIGTLMPHVKEVSEKNGKASAQ